MINHARTLLLNKQATTDTTGEYIQPAYVPRKLPSYLNAIWHTIYGKDLNRAARNYRTKQLMIILHAEPLLEEHVLALDPRVTYLPFAAELEKEPAGLTPLAELPAKLEALVDDSLFYNSVKHDFERFEQLWKTETSFMRKLGGIVLAFIYRVEELHAVEGT